MAIPLLSACDPPVSCVPAELSRANAERGEVNIARRLAASESDPIQAKNPQVRVYLDVSHSLRGFITGATCRDCVSPRAAANRTAAKDRKPDAKDAQPFNDPLFATLVTNLTNLPLRSLPGAPIRYHVFAEKLAQTEQETFARIARDHDCYDQNEPANRKYIEEGVYRPFRDKCAFDSERSPEFRKVGDRSKSPFQETLGDIVQALEDTENPIDEGLFVIATDLFIAKNQDVIGPSSAVVAPLARLIKKGHQVRLYGFQLPFSGRIDDAPASNFRVRGLVPFYYLAIGTPKAVDRFHQQVMAASEQIQFSPVAGEPRRPLAGSDRFRFYAVGGTGASATPYFSPSYTFPSEAAGTPPVVVSTAVDVEGEVATSGSPVTVNWKRPAGTAARTPIQPSYYRADLLAWRWTKQAADGEGCPLSWEIVSNDSFKATPLAAADPDTLTMELFRDSGASVQKGVPYVLQLSLTSAGNQRDIGWIDAWSSDVATINDDLEAAKQSGAFIRTYNLSTLFRSLNNAAPFTAHAPMPPLVSSVLAIRFK